MTKPKIIKEHWHEYVTKCPWCNKCCGENDDLDGVNECDQCGGKYHLEKEDVTLYTTTIYEGHDYE